MTPLHRAHFHGLWPFMQMKFCTVNCRSILRCRTDLSTCVDVDFCQIETSRTEQEEASPDGDIEKDSGQELGFDAFETEVHRCSDFYINLIRFVNSGT